MKISKEQLDLYHIHQMVKCSVIIICFFSFLRNYIYENYKIFEIYWNLLLYSLFIKELLFLYESVIFKRSHPHKNYF